MFSTKETSAVEHREAFIYTKNLRSRRSRHFRILRKSTQPAIVKEAHATLLGTESKSVNLEKFTRYAKMRATVSSILYGYYGNKSQKPAELYFPGSSFEFCVDEKCNLYYGSLFVGKICGFFPQPERESNDRSFKREIYCNYLQIMLQQHHITKRLEDQQKSKVFELSQQDNYVQKISAALENLQLLPFRKLKFSSKLFYDQDGNKLVDSLRGKLGQDAILVFGDWSAPNTKFHEPTRNQGLIAMLKKMVLSYTLSMNTKLRLSVQDVNMLWKPLKKFPILDLSNE